MEQRGLYRILPAGYAESRLDEKTIEKVLHELHWAFDDTSVEQAEKIYCGGEE